MNIKTHDDEQQHIEMFTCACLREVIKSNKIEHGGGLVQKKKEIGQVCCVQ
jgi:hypothetical protein